MPTLRFGHPESPAVVLIHGIPGSPEGWRDVAEELAADHYVLVPELLGFGAAGEDRGILAPQQADALAGLLDAEAISKAAIVGHDFGGPIAMSLYEARPDLFSHFCLLATNAFPDTPIPFPLNTVTWPVLGNAFARLLFSSLSLKAMMKIYGSRHLGDARAVRRIFTASLQNLERLYGEYPRTLAKVDVPSLVIWGDKDPFFPLPQAHRTNSSLKTGRLVILQGAGHYLPETHPSQVAMEIRALIATRANEVESAAQVVQ